MPRTRKHSKALEFHGKYNKYKRARRLSQIKSSRKPGGRGKSRNVSRRASAPRGHRHEAGDSYSFLWIIIAGVLILAVVALGIWFYLRAPAKSPDPSSAKVTLAQSAAESKLGDLEKRIEKTTDAETRAKLKKERDEAQKKLEKIKQEKCKAEKAKREAEEKNKKLQKTIDDSPSWYTSRGFVGFVVAISLGVAYLWWSHTGEVNKLSGQLSQTQSEMATALAQKNEMAQKLKVAETTMKNLRTQHAAATGSQQEEYADYARKIGEQEGIIESLERRYNEAQITIENLANIAEYQNGVIGDNYSTIANQQHELKKSQDTIDWWTMLLFLDIPWFAYKLAKQDTIDMWTMFYWLDILFSACVIHYRLS